MFPYPPSIATTDAPPASIALRTPWKSTRSPPYSMLNSIILNRIVGVAVPDRCGGARGGAGSHVKDPTGGGAAGAAASARAGRTAPSFRGRTAIEADVTPRG